MATYGPYAATKFALEAVSDSLRRELASSGVQVIVVEPGAIRTEMLRRAISAAHEITSVMTPEQSLRYSGLVHAVNTQAEHATRKGLSPTVAAKVITNAVTIAKPSTRYTIGRDAAMITFFVRFIPDRILDRMLHSALRPHFPK